MYQWCYTTYMNNLRELRFMLNLNQIQLANLSEVSRHAVMRMEQLCYPNPLPNVITALSDLSGLNPDVLIKQYECDVHINRVNTGKRLEVYHKQLIHFAQLAKQPDALKPLSKDHPFALWRKLTCDLLGERTSQVHFSIMTSIHPATISKYEAFKTGFPVPMAVALSECNLPASLLEVFDTDPAFNLIR